MFLRQLHYLVALAQEKHFGRAAVACHVSQPALSGAIRSIEDELGIVIVQRGRRFLGFTRDGERVLAWARRVLADCDRLRQDARGGEGDPEGILRMGAIPASLPLVPLLSFGCLQRYPRMRHRIFTLSAAEILRKIAHFELDLGLTYLDDERLSNFETVPIFRERYVLIAGQRGDFEGRESISWEQAAELPLCLFTDNLQCRRGIDAAFDSAGVVIEPVVETDSMTALCAHVHRAGLFSILPHSVLCLEHAQAGLCALPMAPPLERNIGLVLPRQPSGTLLEAAMQTFRALDLQAWVDSFLDIRGSDDEGGAGPPAAINGPAVSDLSLARLTS